MDQRNEYEVILRKMKSAPAAARKIAQTADGSKLPHIKQVMASNRPVSSGNLIGAL